MPRTVDKNRSDQDISLWDFRTLGQREGPQSREGGRERELRIASSFSSTPHWHSEGQCNTDFKGWKKWFPTMSSVFSQTISQERGEKRGISMCTGSQFTTNTFFSEKLHQNEGVRQKGAGVGFRKWDLTQGLGRGRPQSDSFDPVSDKKGWIPVQAGAGLKPLKSRLWEMKLVEYLKWLNVLRGV